MPDDKVRFVAHNKFMLCDLCERCQPAVLLSIAYLQTFFSVLVQKKVAGCEHPAEFQGGFTTKKY